MKDMNHNLVGDIHQVTHQDAELSTVSEQILAFCTKTKSKKELAAFCGFKDLRNFTLKHINPLLESGQLEMTIPDKPKSRNQKYITIHSEQEAGHWVSSPIVLLLFHFRLYSHLSVRRAWRTEHNRPVISTVLKTPAAKRDIPIPKCLVECLREAKENSISDYVIADSKGEPLAASQFQRVWQYVVVRSTKPRNYYKYVNGESIKYTVTPTLGMTQKNQPKIKYTLDFDVTPHQLRHTYITNLLYAGVDPKTVQYLAGHENSKTTMDIYAKVKYNKPEELFDVVNQAFIQDK